MRIIRPQWLKAGSVIKYQTPALGINYDFDTFLNNLPTNLFTNSLTSLSIQWTPDWGGISGKYNNVSDLEADAKYKAFTDYVTSNPTDEKVLNYLKLLESTTTGNGHAPILFDALGNLRNGWENEYRRLRNDGKYGYYHLGPEGSEPLDTSPQTDPILEDTTLVVLPEPLPTVDVQEPEASPLNSTKKDMFTDPYVHGSILANNLKAILAKRDAALKSRISLVLPNLRYVETTDGYALRALLKTQLADMFNRLGEIAKSSDTNRALQILQKGLDYNQQYDDKANLILGLTIDNTRQQTLDNLNYNLAEYNDAANINSDRLAAGYNAMLKAIALSLVERADALNKFALGVYTDAGKYNLIIRTNERAQAFAQNQLNYDAAKQKAYNTYTDWTSDIANSDAWKAYLNAILSGDVALDDLEFFDLFKDTNISSETLFTPEQLLYLKASWEKDEAAPYRSMYERESSNKYLEYYKAVLKAEHDLKVANSTQPLYITNQLFLTKDSSRTSPIFSKKGSKLSRLIDWERARLKEFERVDKNRNLAIKNSNDMLARELGALDDLMILYLKELFK